MSTAKKNSSTYDHLKGAFQRATAKIIIFKTDTKRKLPTDPSVLRKYFDDLVQAYNNLTSYVAENFTNETIENHTKVVKKFEETYKPRFFDSLLVLGLQAQTPNGFDIFDPNTVQSIPINPNPANSDTKQPDAVPTQQQVAGGSGISTNPQSQQNIQTNSGDESEASDASANSQIGDNNPKIQSISNSNQNLNLIPSRSNSQNSIFSNSENEMADQTVPQFLKVAGPLLNYKFDGDPLKLKGFINDIKLISQLAENAATKAFCFKYVMARLEGKAEECVPDDCEDLEELIEALSEKVKPDSAKIVEGRMMALRLEKNNFATVSAATKTKIVTLETNAVVEIPTVEATVVVVQIANTLSVL